MWAIIVDSEISKIINNPKRLTIDDIKYSPKIFSLWTVEEKEAKGIFEIVHDNSNRKDESYYINTNVSYDFDGSEATASYGSATAKLLEDRNEVDEAGEPLLDDNGNQVVTKGLKSQKKRYYKTTSKWIINSNRLVCFKSN